MENIQILAKQVVFNNVQFVVSFLSIVLGVAFILSIAYLYFHQKKFLAIEYFLLSAFLVVLGIIGMCCMRYTTYYEISKKDFENFDSSQVVVFSETADSVWITWEEK